MRLLKVKERKVNEDLGEVGMQNWETSLGDYRM